MLLIEAKQYAFDCGNTKLQIFSVSSPFSCLKFEIIGWRTNGTFASYRNIEDEPLRSIIDKDKSVINLFPYRELFVSLQRINNMDDKPRFRVIFLKDVDAFLQTLQEKAREKIISNVRKATMVLDPELFEKLEGSDI